MRVIDHVGSVTSDEERRAMNRFGEWLCDNLPLVSMVRVAVLIGSLAAIS